MAVDFSKMIGTALTFEEMKKGFHTEWDPACKYAWDCGIGIGRYLEELKNGKLIARKCNKCGRVMIPPRIFCELCFKTTDEWVYVKDTGKVITFSICYITWDMIKLKKPEIPAVIAIDGASEGMGILHLLGNVNHKKVKVGMKVRAVWKPERERTGAITDIKYFKPI
jgi:hypothetical protein